MEKVVITGGSGMLGRALLARWSFTNDLTVLSRSEKMQLPLRAAYSHVRFLLGDIRDRAFLARAFDGQQTIIHAAALKHVPISEAEPTEYTSVNVDGSLSVLAAARAAGARVVGISTDKACQPQNVYGATKYLMERILVEQGQVAIRYGNVFASDGSVVLRWQQQHAADGTITVTDPEMTRFFFRIADAVDAIEWALSLAPSGTVVVPRLRALRLGDLAAAFGGIVRVTGPRPGEKRHEALLSADEGAYGVDDGRRILLGRDRVARPVPALTSDTAERIPREELTAWIGTLDTPRIAPPAVV